MKDNKQRLFEVMGRLDKTFKPTLTEGFEEIEATGTEEVPAEMGAEVDAAMDGDIPAEEQSPEEKLAELTAKVDEIYALLHGSEESAEEPEGISIETGEVEPENLQEWNFDKKKGEKKEEENPAEEKEEEKEEVDESEETKPKVPVEAIAKVGK